MTDNAGTTKPGKPAQSDGSIKSLTKIARILDCFTANQRSLTLAEICAEAGYPRSTTHRLLTAMREVGFIEQDRERDSYRLGLKLFELGSIALANLELHREGHAIVESLHRLTNRAVHLAVFDGLRAVIIQRTEADPNMANTMVENSPAYCTSVGKAILAYQPEDIVQRVTDAGLEQFTETTITDPAKFAEELATTRERGFAIDNGEHQPGLRCIGAPIHNQSGNVFAAISVSAPSFQMPPAEIDELSKVVTYHAHLISQRLGYVR